MFDFKLPCWFVYATNISCSKLSCCQVEVPQLLWSSKRGCCSKYLKLARQIKELQKRRQRCSVKNVLRNFTKFTGKHLCQSLETCSFIKKDTLVQVFSREFCEISKNTFFHRTPQVAASGTKLMMIQIIPHFKPHCNLEKISLK